MSKLLMVATLSAAVLAGTAHAEVNCTEVRPNKKFDTFEFSGAVLKDIKGKLYRTYSTDADTDIRTRCSGDWANPIDHWLYGDDNWLWSDSNKRYDQKGALQAAKTVSQTKPSRFVCEDSAENDAKVGWFSYSYSGKGEMKLEFLCTDPDFRKKRLRTDDD